MTRATKAMALLVPAAVLLSAGKPLTFDRKLGPVETVKSYGYSIRVPEDWSSIPPQPGETRVVGSWQPSMDDLMKKGDYAADGAELQIVRYPLAGAITGPRSEAEKAKEKKKKEAKENAEKFGLNTVEAAETLQEYIDARFDKPGKRYEAKKFVAGRGKNKLEGQFFEFTYIQRYVCAATFQGPNWEWGLFYLAREEFYKKEWKGVFEQSLKSFQLFEPEGDQPYSVTADVDKSKLTPEQRRDLIKAGIAGSPGWWALDTENYVFLTNSKQKGFIKQLANEIEVIREQVYEQLFPPTQEVTAISIVRVFSDQTEYHQYGGPYGSAGYWSSAKEELVLFDNFEGVSKAKSKLFTKAVMYHEAFHQYIYYAVGDVAPHSWFNEGHGDYFAGMTVRGNKVKVGEFDWRVDYLNRHLAMKKGLVPIRSLVRLPQGEYYSNAGLKYSQGWALIYFLRNVTNNETWKTIPNRYFDHLRDNVAAFKKAKQDKDDTEGENVPGIPGVKVYNWEDQKKVERILEEAVDKGFEGVDYEELDATFRKWLESIT